MVKKDVKEGNEMGFKKLEEETDKSLNYLYSLIKGLYYMIMSIFVICLGILINGLGGYLEAIGSGLFVVAVMYFTFKYFEKYKLEEEK